jgi:ketosteroid isomerase-like protein
MAAGGGFSIRVAGPLGGTESNLTLRRPKRVRGPKRGPTVTKKPSADLVEAFTAAMTQEDVDGILELWDSKGEWVVMATGEVYQGIDKIRVIATRSVTPPIRTGREGPHPSNVLISQDGKRFWWEYTHREVITEHRPGSSKSPAVQTVFELPVLLSGDIQNGKLTKIREYFDLPNPEQGRPVLPSSHQRS